MRWRRTNSEHLSGFNFGALNTMTRFRSFRLSFLHPCNTCGVSEEVFASLLYQCPNLVECSARILREFHGLLFIEPLILNHLQRLDTRATNVITMSSSLRHLQLPSLKFLYLLHVDRSHSHDLLFRRNVSATLTTLAIATLSSTLDDDGLYQLNIS